MGLYLAARMRLASATGDSATVLACLRQCLAIARVLAHQAFISDGVVACGIAAMGLEEVRRYAGTGSMSADEARRALSIMDEQLAWPGVALHIEGTRIVARENGEERRLETRWSFRTYNAREFRALLRSVGAFELVANYDFTYDAQDPRPFNDDQLDCVVVLRRKA